MTPNSSRPLACAHTCWRGGRAVLTAVGLLLLLPGVKAKATGTVLTNAAQVRALSANDAMHRLPVRFTGVVTGEGKTGVVVQDATAGIFLFSGTNDYSWLKRGDLIAVNGVSDPGEFAPVVWPRTLTKVGTAPIPAPRVATVDSLASGVLDAQWVRVNGIVRECRMVQGMNSR